LILHFIAGKTPFTLQFLVGETVDRVRQVVAEQFNAGEDSLILRQLGRYCCPEDVPRINSSLIRVDVRGDMAGCHHCWRSEEEDSVDDPTMECEQLETREMIIKPSLNIKYFHGRAGVPIDS
jgi:hypothetical protein